MQTFVVTDHKLSFINIKEEGIICKFLKDFETDLVQDLAHMSYSIN